MGKCKQLFERIDELADKYVGVWERVCSLESPTANKAAVDACGEYIMELSRSLGYTVVKKEEPLSGDPFYAELNTGAAGAPVCLSGHIDTVHEIGFFGTPAVWIENGEIHGPGVTDCKGGVVAALLAMEALRDVGFTARPVRLVIQTDEETSSRGSEKRTVDFMAEAGRGSAAFLNLEGGVLGQLTVGRKGILRYRIDVTGIARHSSMCMDGASAIREAAYKIIELEKWKDRFGVTANVGKIEGGTSVNTVPERCSFILDIRYKTAREREEAEKKIRQIVDTVYVVGTHSELIKVSERVSMERTPEVMALFERVREIFLAEGLGDVSPEERTGGSDAADMVSRGVVALDSLGVEGGYIHSSQEYAYVSSLAECAKRLAAVVVNI
ncbi:MAG: M20/M25/M40 family metallo-hydrolase [Clostridia bacterium]|nr:M20/M25/M40 family metallo-hydrolase [Clostridia bacterium]